MQYSSDPADPSDLYTAVVMYADSHVFHHGWGKILDQLYLWCKNTLWKAQVCTTKNIYTYSTQDDYIVQRVLNQIRKDTLNFVLIWADANWNSVWWCFPRLVLCYSIFTKCAFHRTLHRLNLQIKWALILFYFSCPAVIFVWHSVWRRHFIWCRKFVYNIRLRLKSVVTQGDIDPWK